MSTQENVDSNERPPYDDVLQKIVDYTFDDFVPSKETIKTAFWCLLDTLGCGFRALQVEQCKKHIGPFFSNDVTGSVRIPGTHHQVDPVKAAWDIGCMIRWLDFNDTWLAQEWGHPSDNLGAILSTSDYLARNHKKDVLIIDVLHAMVKAHEIQGVLALENSFNRVGLDHVILVKIASTAVVSSLFDLDRQQRLAALSHAFADGQSLRTYRHAPNTGSRKSWAAGDATSRALRLVEFVMRGEDGIPSVLTVPTWGFYDVSFAGKAFKFQREFGDYVMKNVLFKVSYPAEFHAQTAVEAAIELHPLIKHKCNEIAKIEITTHQSAIRIISKEGPLINPADRDHCIQYMTVVALLFGDLTEHHYSDSFHKDNMIIDEIRNKIVIKEDLNYTKEYHQEDKRAIANAVQVFFNDGSCSKKIEVKYPLGHRRRRDEAFPLLEQKFLQSLAPCFTEKKAEKIKNLVSNPEKTASMPVHEFIDYFIP